MSTKCGVVSGSVAMRDGLAERLQREYRFQQQLAHQYMQASWRAVSHHSDT